jgi:hypothetical protein
VHNAYVVIHQIWKKVIFAKSVKKGRLTQTPKKVKVYGNLSVTVAYDTQRR